MELGLYNHLAQFKPFFSDRRLQHTLFIGKPRTGKTTALQRLALDDMHNGKSVLFIGDDTILDTIPQEKQADVIYFDAANRDFPFAFNILANVEPSRRSLFVNTFLDTVKGVWKFDASSTATLDQYIRAGTAALLGAPDTSLLSFEFLLTDDGYRAGIMRALKDKVMLDFWKKYDDLSESDKRRETSSTLNKIRALTFDPLLRNCFDQKRNALTFKNKVVIVSLRESEIGRENASFIGALILSQLYMDAQQGVATNVYIDGADRFGTAILFKLLSSCPTLSVQLSLQYLDQIDRRLQPALVGSVGTIVALRTSVRDAALLEPEFNLNNSHKHLFQLPPFIAYVAVDGVTTELRMLPHAYPLTPRTRKKIIARCQSQFTTPREAVEARLDRFFGEGKDAARIAKVAKNRGDHVKVSRL